MDTIGHNDTETGRRLNQFLIPSIPELGLLLFLSFLLLCLGNLHLIWATATSSAQLSQIVVDQTLQPSFDTIKSFLGQQFFSQIVVFIVWGFIGCLAYMVAWGVQHTLLQAQHDINQSEYVQPTSTRRYWESKAGHYAYAISAWLVLILFLLGFLFVLWPSAVHLVAAVITGAQTHTYLFLLEAMTIVTVSLYCLVRLWKAAWYAIKILS
jgi:hypothetical protein